MIDGYWDLLVHFQHGENLCKGYTYTSDFIQQCLLDENGRQKQARIFAVGWLQGTTNATINILEIQRCLVQIQQHLYITAYHL